MKNNISFLTIKQHLKTLCYSVGIISLNIAPAYSLPAKIWTAWQPTSLSSRECIRRAEIAVRDTGYSRNLQIFGESPTKGVYGENGQYSATVRCGTNIGIVFFVTAGPSSSIASEELYSLIENF